MIRILFYVVVTLLVAAGFAWLADRPGDLVVTFSDTRYEMSLMVAAVVVAAVVAAVMIGWWVIHGLWNSPRAISRYFRARKRDRGYQSLSTGIIAAGAGDALTARRMTKQASGLLRVDQEPLIKLLDAQASLLEGRHDEARSKFETMLEDPETRILGLRGLYLEAERLGEREAARHYAEKAVEIAPQLGWAGNAAMQLKAASQDWDGALAMLERQRTAGQLEKPEFRRRRAVLLTAKAQQELVANPTAARDAGLEAVKLAPDLVPAAIVAAEALFRLDSLRKGSSIIEKAWQSSPHPDLARAYVEARPGDSALDRLKRAKRLESLRPNHPDSMLAVARASLDAGDFKAARTAVEAVLKSAPREGAWLLLADIEEAETGDQGRVRAWLSKAVRAMRDPAWTAGSFVSDKWLPVSPVTGDIDAFEWKVPVEQLGPVLESGAGANAGVPLPPIMPPEPVAASRDPAEDEPAMTPDIVDAEVIDVEEPSGEVEKPAEAADGEATDQDDVAGTNGTGASAQDDTAEADIAPIPDDPGTSPDDPIEPAPRFRLF